MDTCDSGFNDLPANVTGDESLLAATLSNTSDTSATSVTSSAASPQLPTIGPAALSDSSSPAAQTEVTAVAEETPPKTLSDDNITPSSSSAPTQPIDDAPGGGEGILIYGPINFLPTDEENSRCADDEDDDDDDDYMDEEDDDDDDDDSRPVDLNELTEIFKMSAAYSPEMQKTIQWVSEIRFLRQTM